MQFIISVVLTVTGTAFVLIAGLGVIRMPDLFTRMSATTKAVTLGVGLLLAAAALHFGEIGVTTRAIATVVFLLLTVPVAAHLIGRAAYSSGTPLWEGTVFDDLSKVVPKQGKQEQPPLDTEAEL